MKLITHSDLVIRKSVIFSKNQIKISQNDLQTFGPTHCREVHTQIDPNQQKINLGTKIARSDTSALHSVMLQIIWGLAHAPLPRL